MMLAAIGATKAGTFLGIGTDEVDGNWCHVATLDGWARSGVLL